MKSPFTNKEMKLIETELSDPKTGKSYKYLLYYCEESKVGFTTTKLDEINLKNRG